MNGPRRSAPGSAVQVRGGALKPAAAITAWSGVGPAPRPARSDGLPMRLLSGVRPVPLRLLSALPMPAILTSAEVVPARRHGGLLCSRDDPSGVPTRADLQRHPPPCRSRRIAQRNSAFRYSIFRCPTVRCSALCASAGPSTGGRSFRNTQPATRYALDFAAPDRAAEPSSTASADALGCPASTGDDAAACSNAATEAAAARCAVVDGSPTYAAVSDAILAAG